MCIRDRFTTNCIVPPLANAVYKERMFITNSTGYPGCKYIDKDAEGRKDSVSYTHLDVYKRQHEYPPKLMLIDNETGQALPKDMPEHLLLEEKVERVKLLEWDISIFQTIPMAASVATEDT